MTDELELEKAIAELPAELRRVVEVWGGDHEMAAGLFASFAKQAMERLSARELTLGALWMARCTKAMELGRENQDSVFLAVLNAWGPEQTRPSEYDPTRKAHIYALVERARTSQDPAEVGLLEAELAGFILGPAGEPRSKPPGREATPEEFERAHLKVMSRHAGLFRRLAE